MARVKIIIPGQTITTISIRVRIGDINYGNHVGNDAFVAIIHEARIQWLAQNNFTELDIGGAGLIMSDLEVEFKKEGLYGDIIEVEVSLGELSKVGFDIYYQLATYRMNEKIILVKAKTGMVCYDYANKKVAAVPELFKKLFA